MSMDEVRRRYDAQAGTVATALYEAVRDERYLKPGFMSLMMFRIQQKSWSKTTPDTVDYRY